MLVFLFGFLSGGLFSMIWIFIQSSFVKKIDPSSKATLLFGLSIASYVFFFVAMIAAGAFGAAPEGNGSAAVLFAGIAIMGVLAGAVLLQVGFFSIRASLQKYYRDVDPIGFTQSGEPIGIRLSGAMTFFFNLYYIQYHLTRIAKWKETGVLP
jgi:hypothetical protein